MNNKGNTPLDSTNFDVVLDQIITDDNNAPINSEDQDDTKDQNENTIGKKYDRMLLNNGWNDKNERIIISIGENAASYKWMHERSSERYKAYNRVLSIIMLVISTGLSAQTIVPGDNTNVALDIVGKIFTYILTITSVLQNFLKYERLSEQHLSSASRFSTLYHDIQQQMCMYRRDRINATKYVADILKRYDSIILNAPNIEAGVIKSFKKTFGNSDISVPDIADKIQKIEIIAEPVNTDTNELADRSKDINLQNIPDKRFGRYGICNLDDIHNAFQIHGDISDNDIQNANDNELKELRKRMLHEKSNFEYMRFKEHTTEHD